MTTPQTFYHSPSRKELDRVTQTHTHTDKPYSHFDANNDEITSEGINKYQRLNDVIFHNQKQKTLSKVRSLPHNQFNHFKDDPAKQSNQPGTPQNFRKTANNLNNAFQNTDFNNFSPIPNKAKRYELNQTLNTNIESKEYIGQDFTSNQTPKIINFKTNSGNNISQTRFDGTPQDPRPISISVLNQNQVPNQNQQRRNTLITQILYSNPPKQQQIRTSTIRQSNLYPMQSRNIQKSNTTAADTRLQYQSILIDQQGNQMPSISQVQPARQQKFSFIQAASQIQPTQSVQQYQQVQIERPLYKKIYNNKGQYYRTAGPQQDYYKEPKTCLSKLLPILGILLIILLVAGSLFGVGMKTGLISDKNYLSKSSASLVQQPKYNDNNVDNKFITNQIQNGNQEPVINAAPIFENNAPEPVISAIPVEPTITPEPVVNIVPVIPTIIPQQLIQKNDNSQLLTSPVPTQSTVKYIQQISTAIQPIGSKIQTPVNIVEKIQLPIISAGVDSQLNKLQKNVTLQQNTTIPVESIPAITQPTKIPQSTIEPSIITPIETKVLPAKNLSIQPVSIPKIQVVNVVEVKPIIPVKVEPIKPDSIETITPVQILPTKIQKPIEPVKIQTKPEIEPVKIQTKPEIEPVKIQTKPEIEPVKIETKPEIKPAKVPIIPVTQPIKPVTIPQTKPTNLVVQPITAPTITKPVVVPISTQQADNIVTIIIEQNKEQIPQNYGKSLKKDVLEEFETIPLNFRDAHHVQLLTYKHIEMMHSRSDDQAKKIIPK